MESEVERLRKKRNFGISAHVDAGKTTTTERILYFSGKKHKIVEIHNTKDNKESTTTDFLEEERKRGITIQSAAVNFQWKDHNLTLIDTPGHIDFNIEVNRSLRVLDGVVIAFDGVAGVEPQTETNWRLADQYKVPRICYVNKMDRMGARFFKTVDMLQERLDVNTLVCHLPIGSYDDFRGMIDLVAAKGYVWKTDSPDEKWEEWDLDADYIGKLNITNEEDVAILKSIASWRKKLVEEAVEADDDAMMAYLETDKEPSEEVLKNCIRKGTLTGKFVPIFCGSSFKNKGVQHLLDAVVDYLPTPNDVEAIATVDQEGNKIGERKSSDSEPFAGLAFKEVNNQFGNLTFVRVYSGIVKKGDTLLNSTRGKREKIGRIVEMQAAETNDVEEARAGDIIAFVSMKETITGDTLCSLKDEIILERMKFPDPVISVSIEPKTKADVEKLSIAIGKMVRADPSLKIEFNNETGQTILKGVGELHLEVTVNRMKSEMGVDAVLGRPQVAYKEALTRKVSHTYTHKKQTGGSGQFAEITVDIEPLERGAGFEFVDEVTGGTIPKEFIPAVEKGFESQKETGVIAGYPTVDFRVTLIEGKYHDVDSSALAFEIAAKACFREAIKLSAPVILEPVMKVSVSTPIDYLGDVIGDLNKRRGNILDQVTRGASLYAEATVPLSEMFGYINTLRSMTSGRGTFSMTLSHYAPVPRNVQENIIADRVG
jgi:elongation factor G